MTEPSIAIAIDGPAASGKSTTARGVAERLSFLYVDSGAMYRALAVKVMREGLHLDDDRGLERLLERTTIDLELVEGETRVLVDGEDVTDSIRNEQVGTVASAIAQNRAVRIYLVDRQRHFAGQAGVVMEGRDIGTVVLPDAEVKVYLVAGDQVRSERRCQELKSHGVDLPVDEVRQRLAERDRRDRERQESPLRRAPDAVVIDTSELTVGEQVEVVLELARRRLQELPASGGTAPQGAG